MKSTTIIILIAVALAAGGGGFFGGMQYQKGKQTATPAFGNAVQFRNRLGAGASGGAVRGTIASIQGNTMTVKLRDGSSKIVLLAGSTTVDKTVTGSTGDLTAGAAITAIGTANSDGSVTATTVQLNPSNVLGAGAPPGAPTQAN